MAGNETTARGIEGDGAEALQLVDWWLSQSLYYVLPDRIYWFLGANVSDSRGEDEWDYLLTLLRLQAPHWAQERGPRGNSDVGSSSTAGSPSLRAGIPAPPDSGGSGSNHWGLAGVPPTLRA